MEMGMPTLGWHGIRQIKRTGKWEARWAVTDDKHPGRTRARGKMFLTKEQARKFASDQATGLLNAAVGLTVTRKPIAEALEDFLGRSINPKTTALYERRMNDFLAAFPDAPGEGLRSLPAIADVNQISDIYINRFDKILIARGSNPGGRHHALKIVRTFCKYAIKKKWLAVYPFEDFKMPSSDFEGRPLTDDEWSMLLAPTVGRLNQHALGETDRLLALAFRLGRGTMLRISQVWKLTAADFKEPHLLFVQGIKDQDPEWKPLHGDALTVVRILLAMTPAGERFFHHWGSVQSMQNSVQDKMRRSGIRPDWDELKKRWVFPRFHDACKVTAVSELAAVPGMSIADLANLSNTSQKTLLAHYVKADKARSHEKYRAYLDAKPTATPTGPQTNGEPTQARETAENGGQPGTNGDKQGTGVFAKTPLNLAEKTLLDEAI